MPKATKKKAKRRTKKKVNKCAGGRPTKYKPGFCDLTKYLDHCKATGELPSKCGYAVYLGVAENTLTTWGKKDKGFLRSLERLLTISKQTLMNKGLKGTYTSTIAKLILSSNHGMKERLDKTSGDKPIEPATPLTIAEMKERIREVEEAGTGVDQRSIEGGKTS